MPELNFDHTERETSGTKRPTQITLRGLHPETGDEVGFLRYQVPRRKADKIYIDRLEVHEEHQGNAYGHQLMDELQARHPATPIDHGDRTPAGQGWWKSYTRGKRVQKGRTMASRHDREPPRPISRSAGTTINYIRNPESSTQWGDFGEQYAQHIEPHGRYLTEHNGQAPEGWESGTVTFHNPKHMDFGGSYREPSNWKHRLSEEHGGKTGRELSDAVRAAGHDGIITHDEYGTSEIVDLRHPNFRHAVRFEHELDRCPACHGRTEGDDKSVSDLIDEEERHARTAGKGKPRHRAPDVARRAEEAPGDSSPALAPDARRNDDGPGARPALGPLAEHPKVASDLKKLPRQIQAAYHERVDGLRRGEPHASTHALRGPLRGWNATSLNFQYRLVHRHVDGELHVLSAGNHDETYDQGARRARLDHSYRTGGLTMAGHHPPLYHGTSVSGITHILPSSQHGRGTSYGDLSSTNHAYATTSLEDAWEYAMESHGAHDDRDEHSPGRPRVYEVHPIGGHHHVEDDPPYDEQGRHREPRQEDKRSALGFEVGRELDPPEHLKQWFHIDGDNWHSKD